MKTRAAILVAGLLGAVPLHADTTLRRRPSVAPFPIYDAQLGAPLHAESHGSCHVLALRTADTGLDVVDRCEHDGRVTPVRVPWSDLDAGKVRARMATSYPRTTVTVPGPQRTIALDAKWELVVAEHTITQRARKDGGTAWRIALPGDVEIIDATRRERQLLIGIRLDRGERDGELRLPHDTFELHALPLP